MKKRTQSSLKGVSYVSRNFVKFCLLWIFSLSSLMIQAQDNQRISVDLRGESLESTLWYLQNRTKFIFMYATEDIANITDISVRAKNKTITEILDECLEGTNLTYEVSGTAIVIKKRKTNKITISGWIRDASGEALPGATVTVRGSKHGAIAGLDGHYTFNIPAQEGLILTYSFIGMEKKTVRYTGKKTINVTLNSSSTEIDEVVVTGYQNIQRRDLVGSITTVKAKDILMPSYTTIDQMLQGRVAGMIVTNTSSRVGTAPKIQIRGTSTLLGNQDPLWVVDGIIQEDPLELNASSLMTEDLKNIIGNQISWLNPADIESISILKDASATAIYGARGANGVMLITTKTGKENEKTRINVTVENSFNKPMNFPDFVNGATWMEMYNEAQLTRNPGATPKYSQLDIDNTRNQVNPYIYPDVQWKDVIFKNMNMNQRANVNISGGGSKASYYMSLQANHDTGLLDTKKVYSYNNNINNWGYNFQNNISYKITSTTKIDLHMNAQIRNKKGPNYSTSDLFAQMLYCNPINFPVTFPAQPGDTHIRFGNAIWTGSSVRTNPYAYMLSSFKEYNENTLNTSLKINQKLDFVTKGLSVQAMVNWKNWASSSYNRTIEPYYYGIKGGSYNPSNPTDYEIERLGTSGTDYLKTSDISKASDQTFYLDARVNYDRQFNLHHVTGMLMYMQREYRSSVLPERNQGFSGRFTYDYGQRYLVELNFGYNGTERLAKKERFEFFPAVSLGWVISNEKFFEPMTKYIDNLKIRGSYGLVGSDETGLSAGAQHFLYIDQVSLNNIGFTTGVDMNYTLYGPLVTNYAVVNGGWERVKKLDIGIDLELFRQLTITADYFNEKRYNILLHREAWPESLGYYTAKPWSNKGKVDNWGIELSVNWRKEFTKDLYVDFRGNFTYTENKYVNLDEPVYPYVWKTSTGKPLSRTTGYIAQGLFSSQEEIDNSPTQNLGSTVKPGDIKYRDVNGDGKIDGSDQVMISPYGTTPRIQYGLGMNVTYKKFDFGVFFNGSAKRTIMISGISPFGQSDYNVMQFIADDYWSESNPNPNAKYPRLGLTSSQTANNTVASTYWMRNGNFIRFKTLELGYKFKYGRVYLNGDNIAVFSPFKLWDPELSWNAYPLQRTFNIGVQLNF